MIRCLLILVFVSLGLCSKGQDIKFGEYYKGYYIDQDGERIEGLIRYSRGLNAHIEYKKEKKDKKTKVYPGECRSFVLDSTIRFIKCPKPVQIKVGIWSPVVTSDFIHVITEGKINLYKHYSIIGNTSKYSSQPNDVENLLIAKQGSEKLTVLPARKKKLQETLAELFSDEPEVLEGLQNKDWEGIIDYVNSYNAN